MAKLAGLVAYVSVVVFPTLLLLFLLSLDILPTDMPTLLGLMVIGGGVGLGFFLVSLIKIRIALPKHKNESAK